ncbi:MAG: hypothetical protein WDO56_11445 [Gammaproteobacteria bacterium]
MPQLASVARQQCPRKFDTPPRILGFPVERPEFRNLARQYRSQFGRHPMCARNGSEERGQSRLEISVILFEFRFERALEPLRVTACHGRNQGFPAGEVLVERTDADTCKLCHTVRGDSGKAVRNENASSGVENGLDKGP